MKKIVAIVVSLLLFASVSFAIDEKTALLMKKKSGAALTCNTTTPFAQQTTQNDYFADGQTYLSQKVYVSSPITVCRIDLLIRENQYAACNATVEIWTTANRQAGTQLGSSAIISIPQGTGTYEWHTFTFSTNPYATGDFFVHFVQPSTCNYWGSNTINTSYRDTNYDMYYGSSPGDVNADAAFKIYTIQ